MNSSIASKFRKSAASLQKEIDNKLRPPTQAVTRKRLGEYRSRLQEGRRLEQLQEKLLALADELNRPYTIELVLIVFDTREKVEKMLMGYGPNHEVFAGLFADESHFNDARKALEELGNPEKNGKLTKADELALLRYELALKNIPGYFPTPCAVIERMLERANIQLGERVLEPSAGMGHIAEAICNYGAGLLEVIEINPQLRSILEASGYQVVATDFLDFRPEVLYDVIVMNPPFEKLQDIDHVRHAWECLSPRGRLVSVMSAGVQHNSSKKAVEFREWVAEQGGVIERLPSGAFKESDRATGVETVMVSISKAEPFTVEGTATDGRLVGDHLENTLGEYARIEVIHDDGAMTVTVGSRSDRKTERKRWTPDELEAFTRRTIKDLTRELSVIEADVERTTDQLNRHFIDLFPDTAGVTTFRAAKSPVREQYLQIKQQYPDYLLLFQMGDFYELFDEDAETAARVLDLVLTGRAFGRESARIPMTGIPCHALDRYLPKLLEAGHKVAVADRLPEAEPVVAAHEPDVETRLAHLINEAHEMHLEGEPVLEAKDHDTEEPAYYFQWMGKSYDYHPEYVPVVILKKRFARCYIRLADGHEKWADRGNLLPGDFTYSEAISKAAQFQRFAFRNEMADYSTHTAVAYYLLAARLRGPVVPYVNLLSDDSRQRWVGARLTNHIGETLIVEGVLDESAYYQVRLTTTKDEVFFLRYMDSDLERFLNRTIDPHLPTVEVEQQVTKPVTPAGSFKIGDIVRYKGQPGYYQVKHINGRQVDLFWALPLRNNATLQGHIKELEHATLPGVILPDRQIEFLEALDQGKPVVKNAATRAALRRHAFITGDDWDAVAMTEQGRAWLDAYLGRDPQAAPEPARITLETDTSVTVRQAYLERMWRTGRLVHQGRRVQNIVAVSDIKTSVDYAMLEFAGGGAKGVEWETVICCEGGAVVPESRPAIIEEAPHQLSLF